MTETSQILANMLAHHESNLSKTELKVHNYILRNVEQIIYATVAQLADLVGVGEASILRYTKKIGFSSFAQMKMELFKLISEVNDTINMPFIDQIATNMIKTIQSTKAIIDENGINDAKDLILGHKRLLITGQGGSNVTAQDAFSRFIRIGVDTSLILDNHLLYMYTSTLDENTVVLAYSFSGETKEVIKVVKMAKSYGCKIIGVTNYESSEIASLSDVCLYTSGYEKNIQGGFFSAKVSQIFLTDVLITKCAMENITKTHHFNKRVTKSVMQEEE